jgi:hypothetical protein
MKLIKPLLLAVVLIFALTSCTEEPTTPLTSGSPQGKLSKFTLPAGATFDSAELWIKVADGKGNNSTVGVYNINADWIEGTGAYPDLNQNVGVTWNSFAGSYDANPTPPTFVGDAGWKSVDISSIVSNWLSGAKPNYGILLKEPTPIALQGEFDSKERGFAVAAYLKIFYTDVNGDPLEDTTRVIADTYIWAGFPDLNYGLFPWLRTGRVHFQ